MCFEDLKFPPCIVLRQLLSNFPFDLQTNKKHITEILKTPQSLFNFVSVEAAQQALQQRGAKDVSTAAASVFLERLATDVQRCVECDSHYSPASDAARHSAGLEYEAKLYEALGKAGIAYWTEENLRETGHHKTPDARLRIPMAVKGRVVSWIDSKATFGDEKQHFSYSKEQYSTYTNRYGSGMVVYWHGYLAYLQQSEENVVLVDAFPGVGDIMTLPQLSLVLADEEGKKENLEAAVVNVELPV